jgi:hypothetical protein
MAFHHWNIAWALAINKPTPGVLTSRWLLVLLLCQVAIKFPNASFW